MRIPILKYLPIVVLLLVAGCTATTIKTEDKPFTAADFPNVLDVKGVPDSITDRGVFMFSDKGAWHGYALPTAQDKERAGSFVGPYLLTQDNGVWLSQCLSKMEIVDPVTGTAFPTEEISVIENNSYPNQLQQIFQIKEQVRVQTELIFISSRTTLIKVTLENIADQHPLHLAVRWSGDKLLKEASFHPDANGISIDFGKNENIGRVLSSDDIELDANNNGESYSFQVDKSELAPATSWDTYLSHTFCFTKEEWQAEKDIIEEAFQNPDYYFAQNVKRWDGIVEASLSRLNPSFSTPAHQAIAVKCLQTLQTNWRSAAGFLTYDGLFPTYNYEWFNGFWSWDSWKHAVAIAAYDPVLAENQIKAMYHFQDDYGMIADCVYRDNVIEEHNWRDTKPPLSAWAIWEVYKQSKNKALLEELFPKIEKYHYWWYQYRDINENGLCEYGSTDASLVAAKWESGMDNAVRFDEVEIIENNLIGGSMNCESVDLNAYLFAEKEFLAKIARELALNEKATQYEADALALKADIQAKFYNEEAGWFFDYDLDTKRHHKVFGSEGWIALWTKIATPEQAAAMKEIMMDGTKFATYIPFPTLAADHPKFKPQNGYWRGPVWLDQAYFAIQGLRNYGYEEDALQFSNQLFDRLEGLKNDDGPIRENYHPHTGEGMEANHFSWSAAHLLMLLTHGN